MTGLDRPLGNVFTLGALDFERMRGFYGALGWPQVSDDADFAAFQLEGAVLGIFDAGSLARDARLPIDGARSGVRFSIAIIADKPDEVDRLVARFREAGATITKEATDGEFFEGRDAYLADPEGNVWEIAWAPDDNPITAASRRATRRDA
jgi:predicted lactoylglutathione lyase